MLPAPRLLQVWLINESRTNPTLLGEDPVSDPVCLSHGDAFVIAGRSFKFEYRKWWGVLASRKVAVIA